MAGMWDVYWVGVFLGIGVGLGIGLAGLIGGLRWGLAVAAAVGAALGVGLGLGLGGIEDGIAGGIGGLLGAAGTQRLLSGTLRRGGTRAAAAAIARTPVPTMAVSSASLLIPLLLGWLPPVPIRGRREIGSVLGGTARCGWEPSRARQGSHT